MSRLSAAIVHLLLSVLVACIVATLVFGIWFPAQLRELTGGGQLFLLITGVDAVCGPLLTLVVFSPTKARKLLRRDLTVIAVVQVAALAYGVHTLSYARPVALVFEVDRFRVISFADLDAGDSSSVPEWAQPWNTSGMRTIGIRAPANSAEKEASIDASLQGIEPSQRPSWWQDYELSLPRMLERARPVEQLREKYADQSSLLDAALANAAKNAQPAETSDPKALRWLPLVSRRALDWVVLLDPVTGRARGFVHLDGFF